MRFGAVLWFFNGSSSEYKRSFVFELTISMRIMEGLGRFATAMALGRLEIDKRKTRSASSAESTILKRPHLMRARCALSAVSGEALFLINTDLADMICGDSGMGLSLG